MADMKKEEQVEKAEKKEEAYETKEVPSSPTTTSFCVRKSELMADVKTGSYGRVVIPVKVVDVGDGLVHFMKEGEAKVDGEFSDHEPLDSMKKRIGVAEDR